MRFFKLNAVLLALISSIVAGALFFFVIRIFGKFSEFGSPLNFIGWLGSWFPLGLPILPFLFFLGIVFVRYIFHKNNARTLKMIVAVLTIALLTLLGFLFHSQFWQNSNWKGEVSYLSNLQGAEEAKKDFEAGKLKVLVISGECHEDKFSGTNDGPFELWTAEYYPSLPWSYRYSTEEKIKSYNIVMQSKYKWSLTHTNNVKSVR
jgi:hypothetical protein